MPIPKAVPDQRSRVTALAVVTLGLGLLALATPLGGAEYPASRVGVLLAIAAAVEVLHSLRRSTAAARRKGTTSAVISMAIALFLINAPFVAAQALRLVIAGWFAVDAARSAFNIIRSREEGERSNATWAALGNVVVVVLILLARGWLLTWAVAIAGALRIFGITWSIIVAPVYTAAEETVISELGLADQPGAAAMAAELEAAERTRAPIDRGWTLSFIITLFAIHIGRMSADLTLLGLLSPAVAVGGDMLVAVLFTLLVINPAYLLWQKPTRWIERRVWRWHLDRADTRGAWIDRAIGAWLRWRLTMAFRLRELRYSVPAALNRGLQRGLPIAAILAATVPVWGMSWYFDTENWAAGMWNSWAESRTNTWRESMVRAVLAPEGGSAGPTSFAVSPQGIGSGDFSFVVIGDTGEGDASQHVLRDQLLAVANSSDVRFVVVSSDVVYPTGAMRDYEAKFWLPFKGVTRPVYAIPGNHDWYDALEGFDATFLQPDAARASIRARVESDLRLTSTTDGRIEGLIQEAARLREAYRVPTGFQRAPFFEVQTDGFALVAIDTGVLRKIDAEEERWLEGALRRAAGKTTMAVVGHPFFAGGHDVTLGDDEFARLKQLLLEPRRDDRHGGGHARPRVLRRAGRRGFTRRALLRQRRRWSLSELRHGVELAHPGSNSRLGPLSGPPVRFRRRSPCTRPGGNGRPGGGPPGSMRGRFQRSGCRRCSTTTSRHSSRASSKCESSRRPTACASFRRRSRSPDMGGHGRVREPSPRAPHPLSAWSNGSSR